MCGFFYFEFCAQNPCALISVLYYLSMAKPQMTSADHARKNAELGHCMVCGDNDCAPKVMKKTRGRGRSLSSVCAWCAKYGSYKDA